MTTLAAYVTALGPPERIEVGPLPIPALGPADVLVRTEVLAVNQVDTPAQHYYTHDVAVHGFVISNASVSDLAAAAKAINVLLLEGTLRPRIGARLSLADSAEAHSRQESGNTGGGRIPVTSR